MRVSTLAVVLAATVSLALPAMAANAPLTSKEIKALFATGKPFNGVTVPGGETYTLTLKADGSAVMKMLKGDKSTTDGTWKVSDTSYCSKWAKGTEHCYKVEKATKGYDVMNAAGKVVARWTK